MKHNPVRPDKHKWDGIVAFVWALAIFSVLAGVVVISAYGTYEVSSPGLYSSITEQRVDTVIWVACISQAVGMLLVAVLFSMMRAVYHNTCDVLAAGLADPAQPAHPEHPAAPSPAVENARGRGFVIGYVNESSPLHGIVEPGHVMLRINGTEVKGVKQAAGCLSDGENEVSFLDHMGHVLDRRFQSSLGASLNIRSA